MGIQVSWDNQEQSVIRLVYDGFWGWEDFHQSFRDANQLMETSQTPCVLIIDMRASNYLPTGASTHFKVAGQDLTSDNFSGILVFVKADVIIRAMVELLIRQYPQLFGSVNVFYTNSIAEAQNLAREQQVLSARASKSR